ncbi:hypothetical protein, partial [Mycobacterium sp. E3298]|uniref:hypothetical protein n=1 Tax=Mycobacterium sp. E3298 TaxID=1856865 RepID=UPI0018D2906C
AYRALQLPACDRLTAAIINPSKSDDVTLLHALALAETASPQSQAEVDNRVASVVERRLLELYRPHAGDIYQQVVDQFDSAATAFADAAATTDVEASAASVVNARDEQRAAWTAAEAGAAKLDALLKLLATAAALAGIKDAFTNAALIGLAVDATGLHRRRVWEAWLAEGRCGRWSALHRVGATLRAADLGSFAAYDEPVPVEVRTEQVAGAPLGTYRTTRHDPYDPGYKPAPKAERVMIGGRMAAI